MDGFIKVVVQIRTKDSGLTKLQMEMYLNQEMTADERFAAIHTRAAKFVEVWHAEMADDESLNNVSGWQPLKV